ncbi:MAG TPA: YggS family pyridoxal phosphate-dependent enzyme [Gemmatimonadaceae bacterium]|nr:YggS family pyridoxal phosphate-dependent enzyme [Gemmatimonadaceae bacterium]
MAFPDLGDRVAEIRDRIQASQARGGHGQTIEIVAVTKSHGVEAIEAAVGCGLRKIGENRVQEALAKMPQVQASVEWHLIGHLQRNKVKHLGSFAMLHSLDNMRLADAVNGYAMVEGKRVRALLQLNVSGETTKGGFALPDVARAADDLTRLQGIEVVGAMTMAPYDANEATLRTIFAQTRRAGELLREAGHPARELSMGMSGDYEIAVEEGATLVRLGTILFGTRAT